MTKPGIRSVPLGKTSWETWATAISTLQRAVYEAPHIMTVSGHRNEAFIKSYSRNTSTDQKRQMSETINYIIPGHTK